MGKDRKLNSYLNAILRMRVKMIHQYLAHSELLKRLNVQNTSEILLREAVTEIGLAQKIFKQIRFLGLPSNEMQTREIAINESVEDILFAGLHTEREAMKCLGSAMDYVQLKKNYVIWILVQEIIQIAEARMEWFECQFQRILDWGMDKYMRDNRGI